MESKIAIFFSNILDFNFGKFLSYVHKCPQDGHHFEVQSFKNTDT